MTTRPRRAEQWLAAVALGTALTGCASASTLTVRPTTPTGAELVPTPALEAHQYKRILLLPPDSGVEVDPALDVEVVKKSAVSFYLNKLEKTLLGQGFEVVAPEIVARASKGKTTKHSSAERALIMGKETRADAVMMIQSIKVVRDEKFFHIEDLTEVQPGLRVEEDGQWEHRDTGNCLYRLPYYEIRLEAKMIDVRSGDVLWVGSARETTLDTLKESWTAKLDSNCRVQEQGPFIYSDALQAEDTLDKTVAGLFDNLIKPMTKAALAGAPLEEPKKVEPPPPPPKKEEPKKEEPKKEEPKKTIAVVSSERAYLREAPNRRGKRLSMVPRKTRVEVMETMGVWFKVKVQDGSQGWLHESVVIITD